MDYRLYLLNKKDRIDRALVLSCESEEQAITEMYDHVVGADGAELWHDKRLVKRIAPNSTAKT